MNVPKYRESPVKKKVERMLRQYPELKDNDIRLIINYWRSEIQELETMSGIDVLRYIAEGKVTNPEVIRRSRQALQKKHEDLRGKNYIVRQKKGAQIKQKVVERKDPF